MKSSEPAEGRPGTPLRVLLVEDSEEDALLILRELRRGGYDISSRRIDSAPGLAQALEESWDLVTCDWKMPCFDAPAALDMITARGDDVPVIIVSGEVGEEYAVTAMRAGACDFVSKERLARLAPAVEREVREADERRARKRAEAALRATEQRYRVLIENTSDQVAVVDAEGTYRYVSPSHLRSCGYTPEELIGTRAYDLIHPDDVSVLLQRFADGLRDGQTAGVAEFRVHHKDGSWRVIEAAVRNLLDDPAVGGLLINGRDVTQRRELEQRLRLQGAIFANLAEGVALIRAADGAIVHTNPKFDEMCGYEPGELLGRHISVLRPPGGRDPAAVIGEIREALRASGSWSGELLNRRKDGTEFWGGASISAFAHPEHGEVWITISTDITERRQAQAALEQEREFLATLIRSVPDMVWMKDPDGVFLACNAAFERLMGHAHEEIVGHTDFDLLADPELARFFRARDREAIDKGMPSRNEESMTFAADGREVMLETIKTPVRDASGTLLGVLGIARDITPRREEEKVQRQATALQGQLEKIAATAPGVIYSFLLRADGTSCFPYAGDALRNVYDLDPEAVREDASPFFAIIHAADVGPLRASIAASAHDLSPWRETFRVLHPRRGELWVEGHSLPQREADGSTLWHGILLDVSERREAEEQVRQSESRYRSLFQNMLDGYSLNRMIFEDGKGRDFVFLDVNDAFERLTGLRDVIGRRVSEIVPNIRESVPNVLEIYGRVVASGKPQRFEAHVPNLGWFKISAYPTGADCFVTVFDNITDAKESEARTALQTTALRAAANAIVITDSAGAIVWANPAFTRLTGYDLDEVVGQNPRILKSGEQAPPFYTRLWDTIAAGRVWSGQVVNRRKDGTLYTEEMTITPVHAEDGGAITHFIAVKQDITERQRAGEQIRQLNAELEQRVLERTAALEATNRELEAFSYSVSHDLRAPLRSIDGFSRALLEDYGAQLPAQGREFLETIRGAAERMGQLIAALLSLSRLGRQPLALLVVDAAQLVRDVVAELRPLFAGRVVDLHIGELRPCKADPTLLRQVWLNLLANALKYTAKRETARVEVGCQMQDGENVYFVRDNGAGFDMRYADRLFGVFQRLHSPAEFEGTGVGLAIVQRIVHRHGGRVWAEAGENLGATFYFTLGAAPVSDKVAPKDGAHRPT